MYLYRELACPFRYRLTSSPFRMEAFPLDPGTALTLSLQYSMIVSTSPRQIPSDTSIAPRAAAAAAETSCGVIPAPRIAQRRRCELVERAPSSRLALAFRPTHCIYVPDTVRCHSRRICGAVWHSLEACSLSRSCPARWCIPVTRAVIRSMRALTKCLTEMLVEH